jgi:hypothetical protein
VISWNFNAENIGKTQVVNPPLVNRVTVSADGSKAAGH